MKLILKISLLSLLVALMLSLDPSAALAQKKKKKKKKKKKGKTEQVDEKPVEVAPEPEVDTSESDALLKEDRDIWGPDSNKTVTNYSLYREYFKQKLYDDALPYWRYVFANAPKARKTPYLDGEKMYRKMLDNMIVGVVCKEGETEGTSTKACKEAELGRFVDWKYDDDAKATAILDTISMLLNKRAEYFGEQGYLFAKEGQILSRYRPQKKDEVFKLYEKSIEIEQESSPYFALYPYFIGVRKQYAAKEIEENDILAIYDKLMYDIIDYNIANEDSTNTETTVAKYEKTKGKIQKWADKRDEQKAERKAALEKQHEEYMAKWKATQDSVMAAYRADSAAAAKAIAEAAQDEAAQQAYNAEMQAYQAKMDAYRSEQAAAMASYNSSLAASSASAPSMGGGSGGKYAGMDCGTLNGEVSAAGGDVSALKSIYSAMKRQSCSTLTVLEKIVASEPDGSKLRYLAQQYQKQKNYSKAGQFYQQSLQYENDPTKKAQTLMRLAKIERVANKNFSKARKFAREAAQLQAGWGDPYIFIGDMYMSSRGSCKDKFDGYSVYWVAYDMYNRAADIDPAVASKARSKAGSARSGFPSQEKIFFAGQKPGGRYKVGCWIQQSTTMR